HSTLTSFSLTLRPPPTPTLFPYTTLFRSNSTQSADYPSNRLQTARPIRAAGLKPGAPSGSPTGASETLHPEQATPRWHPPPHERSEEHMSELQSRENLVCRLLLEKKKKKT